MIELFHQQPPSLGNQYTDDRVLRSFLRRALPRDVLAQVEPDLTTMGELAGGNCTACTWLTASTSRY